MLYGVLGFQATAEGYELHPRVPKDWPSLTISGIRFHDQVLDITAYADGRVETKPSECCDARAKRQ
jgi:cellobiose phosphorylase